MQTTATPPPRHWRGPRRAAHDGATTSSAAVDLRGSAPRLRSSLRWVAIAATFINLGIHLTMAPDHLSEMPYIGVMFVIGAVLLGMVMVGLGSDHDRLRTLAWVGGSLVCVVEFILFVASRTIGLPGGYLETWASSMEDFFGLASLFVEIVFIACALAALTRSIRPGQLPRFPWHDRTAPLA